MAENDIPPPVGPAPAPAEADSSPAPVQTEKQDVAPETTEEAGTSSDDAHTDEAEGDKPPVNPRVRDLISLRKRAQEAEARAKVFEQLLRDGQRPAPAPPPAPPQFDPSPYLSLAPDPAKFPAGEFDPDYIRETVKRDLQADAVRAEMGRRYAAQQVDQQRARQNDEAILLKARDRLDDAAERIPDLQKHVGALAKMSDAVGDVLTIAIAESDLGPEIVQHFATNEADRARLASMSHAQAALFVGRIEERISRTREAASATQAPAPPQTLTGKGMPRSDLYDPSVPMDEFAKRYRERFYQR